MPAAAAAILDGMPDARDLHRLDTGGQTMIFAGSVQLFQYAEDDTAARNVAVAVLRQLGFGGEQVAALMQLTPNYVATLRQRSLRDGTAGLIRPAGRPRETADASWEQARAWRAEGMRDAEIARRLRVNQSTVLRRLGRAHLQEALPLAPEPAAAEPGPAEPQVTEPQVTGPEVAEPEAAAGPRPVTVSSRYAGTMLLHAFFARAAAGPVLAAAGGPEEVRLLTAVSMCFALGAGTAEQFKHLAAAEAGPLAGLPAMPGLRALRPALADIADRTDPLEIQSLFAAGMLTADPVVSGVYYVDDHFVPYTGAKPVAKGWNNKRGRAGKGRADTHVTAHDGRAVCFVSGEPSGLTATLPKALAELRKAAGPGADIMLGFDRGGAYPQVFKHCREQQVRWVTYRRAPLAVPAMLPVITGVSYGGRTRDISWTEETVQLKDYGDARQITLFEHDRVALQILTSDFDACPADILSWLKSRWREENFLKYRVGQLRDRQDLRLPRRHRGEHQAHPQPRPRQGQRRRPRRRESAGQRRTRPRCPARQPGPHRRGEERPHPRPAGHDRPRPRGPGRRRHRPQAGPRQAARQQHRPGREDRAAARRAPRPADGPAAARAQRRALALQPPQRLPPRRRRIPRHHPRDHHQFLLTTGAAFPPPGRPAGKSLPGPDGTLPPADKQPLIWQRGAAILDSNRPALSP